MSRSPARQRGGQGTPGRPHAATTGPGCPPGAAKSPVPFGGAALPWDGVVLAGDTDPWAHPKPGPSPSSAHPGCLHGEELFFFFASWHLCARGPHHAAPPRAELSRGFFPFSDNPEPHPQRQKRHEQTLGTAKRTGTGTSPSPPGTGDTSAPTEGSRWCRAPGVLRQHLTHYKPHKAPIEAWRTSKQTRQE